MNEDGSSPNIQNDFFNQARREKRRLAVLLNSGRRLTGRIRSFDKFTLILDTGQGEQIIFKHAIATVGPAPMPAAGSKSRQRPGFNNRIAFDEPRGVTQPSPGGTGGSPAPAAPVRTQESEPDPSEGSGGGSAPVK